MPDHLPRASMTMNVFPKEKLVLSGPPQRQVDFSIFKDFQISERIRTEFRAEMFNMTNTPSFNIPTTTNFQSSVFGRLDSQRNNPRQIQLALKLYF